MLESIIIIGLYVAILEAWLYPYKEKLKTSTSVKQSVSIRKKMKWIRNISIIVFLILYVVIGPIVTAKIADIDYAEYWQKGGTPAIGYLVYNVWQAFRQKEDNNPLRPISCKTKGDVLNAKKPFILYLRGFQNDDYSCQFNLEIHGKIVSFSEYNLIKEISERIPVFAIGMTKETYSPIGADRVYLDDTTWKSDIQELMIAAEKIVVLVDDKENCLWEIEQTQKLKRKTIFIVNDYYKYLMAKLKLEGKFNLPRIEEEFQAEPFYMVMEDNEHKVSYIKRLSSYIELANDITNTLPNLLSRFVVFSLKAGMMLALFTIGAFATIQINEREPSGEVTIIATKISICLAILLYIIANWLMLKKKKKGLYISFLATFLISLSGIIRGELIFFIIAGVVGLITVALMCIKTNKRTGFQVLGHSRNDIMFNT